MLEKKLSRFPRSFKRLKCKTPVNYQCGGKCQPIKNNCKKMALGMAKNGLEYLKALEERKSRIAKVNTKRGGRTLFTVDDSGNVGKGMAGRVADPAKRVYKGDVIASTDGKENAIKLDVGNGRGRYDDKQKEVFGKLVKNFQDGYNFFPSKQSLSPSKNKIGEDVYTFSTNEEARLFKNLLNEKAKGIVVDGNKVTTPPGDNIGFIVGLIADKSSKGKSTTDKIAVPTTPTKAIATPAKAKPKSTEKAISKTQTLDEKKKELGEKYFDDGSDWLSISGKQTTYRSKELPPITGTVDQTVRTLAKHAGDKVYVDVDYSSAAKYGKKTPEYHRNVAVARLQKIADLAGYQITLSAPRTIKGYDFPHREVFQLERVKGKPSANDVATPTPPKITPAKSVSQEKADAAITPLEELAKLRTDGEGLLSTDELSGMVNYAGKSETLRTILSDPDTLENMKGTLAKMPNSDKKRKEFESAVKIGEAIAKYESMSDGKDKIQLGEKIDNSFQGIDSLLGQKQAKDVAEVSKGIKQSRTKKRDVSNMEPWELTRDEYLKLQKASGSKYARNDGQRHKNMVATALGEGKDVPNYVLSRYPDITTHPAYRSAYQERTGNLPDKTVKKNDTDKQMKSKKMMEFGDAVFGKGLKEFADSINMGAQRMEPGEFEIDVNGKKKKVKGEMNNAIGIYDLDGYPMVTHLASGLGLFHFQPSAFPEKISKTELQKNAKWLADQLSVLPFIGKMDLTREQLDKMTELTTRARYGQTSNDFSEPHTQIKTLRQRIAKMRKVSRQYRG